MKLRIAFLLAVLTLVSGCASRAICECNNATGAAVVFEDPTFRLCQQPLSSTQLTQIYTQVAPQNEACRSLIEADSTPAEAYFYLGRNYYEMGFHPEAFEYFRQGVEEREVKAFIAFVYMQVRMKQEPGELMLDDYGLDIFQYLADAGDTTAKLLVAGHFSFAGDEYRDLVYSLVSEAADEGHPVGHLHLAIEYLYGSSNEELAAKHLRVAAEGGVGIAHQMLHAMGLADFPEQAVEDSQFGYGTMEEVVMRQR